MTLLYATGYLWIGACSRWQSGFWMVSAILKKLPGRAMSILMFPVILAILAVLIMAGLGQLVVLLRKRRRQAQFIRGILASGRRPDDRRVIVSMSTVPDRIGNLTPTIRSLLDQARPPDEIVIALPEFSIREQRPYVVPDYIARLPRVRILHCGKDWGPATKFIPVVQEELAASRDKTLIMVVDDDRTYPRDALETYLHYSGQLPEAALCFRGAAMPTSLDWRRAKMIKGASFVSRAARP